jgi:[acyl-carrier-protein] S-malonyltransferase
MSLGFIFGTSLLDYDHSGAQEFYDQYPVVREVYRQVDEWTGYGVDALLGAKEFVGAKEDRDRVGPMGLATAMFGIYDVLAEKGIHPAALGGLSMGAMVSSCLAGALSRRQLVETLVATYSSEDVVGTRPQGIVTAFPLLETDLDWYYGEQREGVYLGGDFGVQIRGNVRILLLSGYRDALEQLVAEADSGRVQLADGNTVAVHCPLRYESNLMSIAHMRGLDFHDPVVTLCSGVEQKTLTTAAEVEDMFHRNAVEPLNLVALSDQLKQERTRLGLVLGPSLPRDMSRFPFPVVYIDAPEHIEDVVSAIFEMGIKLPQKQTNLLEN